MRLWMIDMRRLRDNQATINEQNKSVRRGRVAFLSFFFRLFSDEILFIIWFGIMWTVRWRRILRKLFVLIQLKLINSMLTNAWTNMTREKGCLSRLFHHLVFVEFGMVAYVNILNWMAVYWKAILLINRIDWMHRLLIIVTCLICATYLLPV